jgi:hypothetical protein
MADGHDRVHLLDLAQSGHDRAGRLLGVSPGGAFRQVLLADEPLHVRPRHREETQSHSAGFLHDVGSALRSKERRAVRPQEVRREYRERHPGPAALESGPAVVEVVVAQGHHVHEAVEPRPFHAAVLVAPGRRALVEHVPARHDHGGGFAASCFQEGDGPGDPALGRLPLGVGGHRMGVVVGEGDEGRLASAWQSEGRALRVPGRSGGGRGQEERREVQCDPPRR